MLLTREQVKEALVNCPKQRRDIRHALRMMLDHIKRGIKINDTAPAWVQAQNVIFVSRIDGGGNEEDDS